MNFITVIYLCLIFFTCLRLSLSSDSLDITGATSLNDICPYTNYCTRNATKSIEDVTKTPCCIYCSCADDCWKRGNCCMDKQNITVKQPLEHCIKVSLKERGLNIRFKNLPRYYVIQSCPTLNDALAEKCSGNIQSSLEDFIWMTDERTNKIYNNRYCAECHGVVNYTYWQLATDCTDPMNGQTSSADAINRIIDSCSLVVLPPKSTDVSTNQCLVPTYTTCNVTGRWRTYDQALETACNQFSQIYILENRYMQVYYRNIYCFLCNVKPHEQLVRDVCTSYTNEEDVRTDLQGFTAILDFTTIKRQKAALTDSVCASDEIKDPFQVCVLTCYLNRVFKYS